MYRLGIYWFHPWITFVYANQNCPNSKFKPYARLNDPLEGNSIAYVSFGIQKQFSIEITSTPFVRSPSKFFHTAKTISHSAVKGAGVALQSATGAGAGADISLISTEDKPICNQKYFSAITSKKNNEQALKTKVIKMGNDNSVCCIKRMEKNKQEESAVLPLVLTDTIPDRDGQLGKIGDGKKGTKKAAKEMKEADFFIEAKHDDGDLQFDGHNKYLSWFIYQSKQITYYVLGEVRIDSKEELTKVKNKNSALCKSY